MTFVARGRILSVKIGRVLMSECCIPVQRNLISKKYLHSSFIYNQNNNKFDVENYFSSGKVPENFDKIVELEEGYEEVEVPRPSKRKRKVKVAVSPPAEISDECPDVEESCGSEHSLKKIHGNENVHTKYKDMNKNTTLLTSVMTVANAKNIKKSKDSFVLEGKRLIYDACNAGLIPEMVFFTRVSDVQDLNLPKETKLLRVPYKVCQVWSKTETSQGIIGVFNKSALENMKVGSDSLPLTVICDNIRDPGNLGSVLRVVAGAGCNKLILTPGCVDVWGPKVLRAGAGAHFHLPVFKSVPWTDIEDEVCEDCEIFLADGICNDKTENDSEEEGSEMISKFTNVNRLFKNIPTVSSLSVEFSNKSTVLIIGGETHGASKAAYEFANKRKGTRIFIPMENKVESLNTSVALGILIYEFKRQFSHMSQEDSLLSEKSQTS